MGTASLPPRLPQASEAGLGMLGTFPLKTDSGSRATGAIPKWR